MFVVCLIFDLAKSISIAFTQVKGSELSGPYVYELYVV